MSRAVVLALAVALLAPAGSAARPAPLRATVLVDSVLLGGMQSLQRAMPGWRIERRGRPALMVRAARDELRHSGARVAPVVVIGLGYNSLWERTGRRYRQWARRFDAEASGLLELLRARGARRIVWVTLREATLANTPSYGFLQIGLYAWYFPYVNARLRRLDLRHHDVVLADWAAVSGRRGLTYDAIHLTPRGARLMAMTVRAAVLSTR